jgi:hypothetical protein
VNESWGFFFAVAGLVINGAGIAFIAFQVTLARRQMKLAQKSELIELVRRRRQATTDAYNATQHYRGSIRESLPDDWNEQEIKKFLHQIEEGDVRLATLLHDYLGHLETFSVAVSAGIYDIEVLDSLCGPRLIKVMENYGDYISARRTAIMYDGYCAELQWSTNELSKRNYSRPPYQPLAERLADRPPPPERGSQLPPPHRAPDQQPSVHRSLNDDSSDGCDTDHP